MFCLIINGLPLEVPTLEAGTIVLQFTDEFRKNVKIYSNRYSIHNEDFGGLNLNWKLPSGLPLFQLLPAFFFTFLTTTLKYLRLTEAAVKKCSPENWPFELQAVFSNLPASMLRASEAL
eukprot:IDg21548t1